MTAQPPAPAVDLLDRPVVLRPDVQVLTGADAAPMLFDPVSGRYTRLGAGTVRFLDQLDGSVTPRQVALRWSQDSGRPAGQITDRLDLVLAELAVGGLLDGVDRRPTGPRPVARAAAGTLNRTPTATFPLLKASLPRLVGPAASVLGRIPAASRVVLAVALAVAGCVTGLGLLLTQPLPTGLAPYLSALVVVLLQTVLHEAWHAVVCQLHGVAPRELGIALWYGFMPIAYVDRTDSYRLSGRGDRIAICVAGPVQDLAWVIIYSALAATVDGPVGHVAHVAVVFSLYLVVFNLNPLLPTDGQQAVEAALGEVNFRGRAMAYLAHLVLRVPLPSYLLGLSTRRRSGYLVYGAVCSVYLIGMLALFVMTIVGAIRLIGGA